MAEGFDLQVTPVRPTQTTLVLRRLFTVKLPLAAHRDYVARRGLPHRPEDLVGHECLRFFLDTPQDVWNLVGPGGEARAVPVGGHLESTSSEVLYGALLAGLGIGVCGRRHLQGDGAGRGLVPVLEGWTFEELPLYAVFPRASRKSRLVEAFLDVAAGGFEAWI